MRDPGMRRGASDARGDCARGVKRGASQGSVVWRNPRDRSPRRVCLPKNPSVLSSLGFTSPHRHTPHPILTCRPASPWTDPAERANADPLPELFAASLTGFSVFSIASADARIRFYVTFDPDGLFSSYRGSRSIPTPPEGRSPSTSCPFRL